MFCDNVNPPETKSCTKCGAELSRVDQDETKAAVDKLTTLIRDGRKIEAIKLFRERTGAGLKEAKDAVEAIERGDPLPTAQPLASEFDEELLPLLRAGKKIEAIKRYRKRTDASLAQSKHAVEALASQHGIQSQAAGCASVLLAAVIAGSIVASVMR